MADYTLKNSNIIKGSHLMVFLDGNPIAFATSHSLSKTLNTQDISTKDHGDYNAILPQTISWEITTENLYSLSGYAALNTAFNTRQAVTVAFGESTYAQDGTQASIVLPESAEQGAKTTNWALSGDYEEGQAYITSLQVTAGSGDNATFSATFTGTGDLTSKTAS